jgi:hypothetical protein
MSVNYFNKFPKVLFDVNNDGIFSVLTDITKTVDINTFDNDSITYYTFQEIGDGERPDNLSYRLYGTPQYYWTFFVINDGLKAGLGNSWPCNSHEFESMMVKEYDDYSAITFDPILHAPGALDSDGFLTSALTSNKQSDFSVVPLNVINDLLTPVDDQDQYLPYLRLISSTNGAQSSAKILKYDNSTCQLVLYDIIGTSRSSFISNLQFKLRWDNPYNSVSETSAYNNNQELKKRYVNAALAYFEPIDRYDYPGRLADNNPGTIPKYENTDDGKASYVFDKIYTKVPNGAIVYSWDLYRNATAQYTSTQTITVDGETVTTTIPVSVYDVLYPPNPLNTPPIDVLSFYEKEETANSDKRNIKVIRPEVINRFSKTYFDLLNT